MIVLQAVIEALTNQELVIQHKAITLFSERYRKLIAPYAQEKYGNHAVANDALEIALATAVNAIIHYKYRPNEEHLLLSLKYMVAIPFYEEKYCESFYGYINQQKNNYLSIEKKLRQRHHPITNLLTSSYTGLDEKSTLGKDWITQQVFDTYFFKLIGKDDVQKRNRVVYFNRLFQDKYSLFCIRYGKEIEKEKELERLNQLCKEGIVTLPNFDADIFSQSIILFVNELKDGYVIPKSSLKEYWSGIYKVLLLEKIRKKNATTGKPTVLIKHDKFSKEEVFAFILEGMDAIQHVHAGKARALLLTARNQHTTRLIQEAILGYVPAVETVKAMPALYDSKTSEAQQRQDCKKALIAWMKNEINDPASNWYGSRGLAMIDFILQKES